MNKPVAQTIENCGFCSADNVEQLEVMKAGMTNRSYSFYYNGKRYVIRIPGVGTEQLINRAQEFAVYNAVQQLHIGEDVFYFDPKTGIKIAAYLKNARTCDASNPNDVQRCMNVLRTFHDHKLEVDHTFDYWERMDYYESLWEGNTSCYPDYSEVKKAVCSLKHYLDQQPIKMQLCHIDAIADNFMFVPDENGTEHLKLIDWEYAGMQDPHLDIAMFAIYSMYDRDQTEALIDAYFLEGCPDLVRLKIYCYIAISGLLWSNWCEYKHHCGVEFGEYALRQFQYAKEYTTILHEEYRKVFHRDYE